MTEAEHILVGVCVLRFHLPGAHSLKDRRRHVKSFRDRLAVRYPVSICEVNESEGWQTATLAVAVVGEDGGVLDSVLQSIVLAAESASEMLLTSVYREYR